MVDDVCHRQRSSGDCLARVFDTLVAERVTGGALGHLVPGPLWLLFHFSQFPSGPHSLP